MPRETIERPLDIYQLKVTLLGTRPPIWRRLLIPSDLTLEQLHSVLQAAMGWEDCHMHDFRIGSQRFGKPDPSKRFLGRSVTPSERTTRLFAFWARLEPRRQEQGFVGADTGGGGELQRRGFADLVSVDSNKRRRGLSRGRALLVTRGFWL